MKNTLILLSALLFFFNTNYSLAQSEKSREKKSIIFKSEDTHSPRKAALYSLCLPGLGQAYNKKYLKIPIIYAGFGALIYAVSFNTTEFKRFKKAYTYLVDDDSTTIDEFQGTRSSEELLYFKEYYQRNMELSYIGIVALYALNIIDATVDGYFYSFDINQNLSLGIRPKFNQPNFNGQTYGLAVNLKF